MAHQIVKLITDDDGDLTNDSRWHYVVSFDGADRTLCTLHVFGFGESEAEYKEKTVSKGGITCPACLGIIKEFKAIKL